jgi:hypothetical protein
MSNESPLMTGLFPELGKMHSTLDANEGATTRCDLKPTQPRHRLARCFQVPGHTRRASWTGMLGHTNAVWHPGLHSPPFRAAVDRS